MKSLIVKRSVVLDGQKTSLTLEDAFWAEIKEIARIQNVTVSRVVAEIDATRKHSNLSSAIRVYVLEHLQEQGRRTSIGPLGINSQSPRGSEWGPENRP